MNIETDGFLLECDETDEGIVITGYEGEGAVLDISSDRRIFGIDKKVFLNCNSLRKVMLPDSIRTIGDWCFSNCRNLSSVRIGTSAEDLHDHPDSGEQVSQHAAADGRIFGRGVFEACDRLRTITFSGTDKGTSLLLAAGVNRMSNEHILRSDDIGERFWYEKWDISLLSLLNSDDAENTITTAVSGEEDISYDGVAMVDGEMSGPTSDHVKNIAKNKSFLCFLRLLNDAFLSPGTRDKIEEHIKERSFGSDKEYSWITLKEDCEGDVDYYEMYLKIVHPDRDTILRMIEDLGPTRVQAKALLINRAEGRSEKTSILDEMML